MLPFSITSSIPAENLYKLKAGKYQLVQSGNLGPFLFGYSYLVIEEELANYLMVEDVETISVKDVVIWDRKLDVEYLGYKELRVNQHFQRSQINDINLDGDRILMMDNMYVFVSPSLKLKLENTKFDYLEFSEGLEKFA